MRITVVATVLLAAAPALAADPKWTPAPVPSVEAQDTVLPAARAGRSTGPDHDAPYSGIPARSITANGATSRNKVDGVKAPDLSPQ